MVPQWNVNHQHLFNTNYRYFNIIRNFKMLLWFSLKLFERRNIFYFNDFLFTRWNFSVLIHFNCTHSFIFVKLSCLKTVHNKLYIVASIVRDPSSWRGLFRLWEEGINAWPLSHRKLVFNESIISKASAHAFNLSRGRNWTRIWPNIARVQE